MATNKPTLLILFFVLLVSVKFVAAQNKQPNVIVFIADDFGYGSTNIYGASKNLIKTPNINKLAKEGVKFNNAYTTGSVCSPTRYGVITGQYSWRTSLKKGVVRVNGPALIDQNKKTLPKYMQSLGYKTAIVGKWHLGLKAKKHKNLLGNINPSPNNFGFDYSFIIPNNLDDVHKIYVENHKIAGLRSDKIAGYGKSFYGQQYIGYDAPQRITENVTDDLTDKALNWLETVDKKEPFFLYYAAAAVHHPIVPSPKMRGKSNAGAYGDFIQDIDRSLGDLIHYLEENGIRENTIIIFASDNGGDIPNKKWTMPENFAINKGLKINGNYKGDKHTIWDGGFRIPFIVNYPKKIKGNKTSDVTVSTVDIYAFLADYVGHNKGLELEDAPDSYSFKNAVEKPSKFYKRPPLVHRDAKGRKAIRFDDWKYIEPNAKGENQKNKSNAALLYNLKKDVSESKNLVTSEKEITKQAQEYLNKVTQTASKLIWKKNK